MSSRLRGASTGIDINGVNVKRYISLDLFRGVIMVFLLLESTFLFENLKTILSRQSFGFTLLQQFFHVPWIGLHFWDLIQPGFFLFVVDAYEYYEERGREASAEKMVELVCGIDSYAAELSLGTLRINQGLDLDPLEK